MASERVGKSFSDLASETMIPAAFFAASDARLVLAVLLGFSTVTAVSAELSSSSLRFRLTFLSAFFTAAAGSEPASSAGFAAFLSVFAFFIFLASTGTSTTSLAVLLAFFFLGSPAAIRQVTLDSGRAAHRLEGDGSKLQNAWRRSSTIQMQTVYRTEQHLAHRGRSRPCLREVAVQYSMTHAHGAPWRTQCQAILPQVTSH